MKKINTLNSVIQTTEGRKNLGITKWMLPRSFAPLWMTVMMVLAFTACSEEDLVQPTNGEAGSLRIASVIIDGQEVGRSRMAYEGSVTHDYHYNRSITGFSDGDVLTLDVGFTGTNREPTSGKAVYENGTWSIVQQHKPDPTNDDEYWKGVYIKASISSSSVGGKYDTNGKYRQVAQTMGIVQGDIPVYEYKENVKEYHYSFIVGDWLAAKSNPSSQDDKEGYGSITIDTDLNSPTLGATTIVLKHCDRALLRLPMTPEALKVTPGDYIVNGERINLTSLASLWAVFRTIFSGGTNYEYFPFTKVTIGEQDYLQAIVSCSYSSFVGFKAVMCTNESGKTHTLDLPFKVGGTTNNNYKFASNTQYPMKLSISPNSAAVTFTTPEGKPGWALDEDDEEAEEELSNAENERDLSYITASNTFLVGSAEGLRNLNKWMMRKTTTADFKDQVNFVPASSKSSFNINGGTSSAYAKNIKLMADITLPNTDINGNAITITDGVPSGSNWIPIGKGESTTDGPYTGVFDGNGKTIKNLTIVGSEDDLGLIHTLGKNGKGEVKNLTLENVTIKSSGVYIRYIGGIAGNVVANAKVSGCTVRGNLSGQYCKIGGIVGQNKGSITNCINYSEVSGNSSNRTMAYSSFSGGIAGDLTSTGAITGCTNFGNVNNYYAGYTGGIAGHSEGNITDCTTTEGVILTANCNESGNTVFGVGGIVGKVGASSSGFAFIQGCTNHATVKCEVKTTFSVGGVVGFAESANNTIQIINNINKGNLFYNGNSGSPHVGGLVGYTSGNNVTAISGCINQGDVTYTSSTYYNYVGGIVGQLANSHYCVASGNTGNLSLTIGDGNHLWEGGIVGYGNDSKIIGCWTKDVGENEGTTAITQGKDGFGALGNSSTKENCYIAGSGDESAQKAFFDDEVVSNMNRAIIDFALPNQVTKYYWVTNNDDWPTLTTDEPNFMPG